MGKTKYVNKGRKQTTFIDGRGARNKYGLIIEDSPFTRPGYDEPTKTLTKKASQTNKFKVIGGVGELKYDLVFNYKMDKFEFGDGSIQWLMRARSGTWGAVKYTGPITHFMECTLTILKVSNIGSGKSCNPQINFQLKQWYGPLLPMPKTAATVTTNGHLDMVSGKLRIQKTSW